MLSAEHEAKMAEIGRQQAEARRAREEAEAKVRAANAAEEAKKKADHEAEMAKIERERQAEIALLRFTQWGVKVSKTGTMIIWGDDAEAQNGFGVWLKVNYSCEVDLTSKKIVNVTMEQGRLPDPTVY